MNNNIIVNFILICNLINQQHYGGGVYAATENNSTISDNNKNNGTFSFQHFLIILFVVGIMLFLSFSLIQLRIRLKNRMIDNIPRKIMPFLRPGDLSNKQRTIILNEIVRSKQIQSQIEPIMIGGNSLASTISHLGWGPQNSQHYSKIHFKTSISKSWIVLERAATHLNPSLKRDEKLCIRDYVDFLIQNSNGKMDKQLANYYIETYEKARFSDQEFSLEEYTVFMSKLVILVKTFELTNNNTNNNNLNNLNNQLNNKDNIDDSSSSCSSTKLKIN